MFRRVVSVLLGLLMLASVAGCPDSFNGTLSLYITDTPVDGVESVFVAFSGVTLMGPHGQVNLRYGADQTPDLLTLQGLNKDRLLDSVLVPAGDYKWLRLDVDVANSYVISSSGGKFPLSIPSGSEGGLKLVRGFTVPEGGTETSFLIDLDLRKALTLDNSAGTTAYVLTPMLRLMDLKQTAVVTGQVSSSLSIGGTLITATNCRPAVYVYSGSGVVPGGYDAAVTGGTAPVTSATVSLSATSGNYNFADRVMAPGTYTLAVTCAAADTSGATTLAFSPSQTATVTANRRKSINF